MNKTPMSNRGDREKGGGGGSDLHVGLLGVRQLLDDLAQPLGGAHVLVTRPGQGGVSGGDPCRPPRSVLCPVHQTPGGRARPLLEGAVQGAHGVHALQMETDEGLDTSSPPSFLGSLR